MSLERAHNGAERQRLNAYAREAILLGATISELARAARMRLDAFRRKLDEDIRNADGRFDLQLSDARIANKYRKLKRLIKNKRTAGDTRISISKDSTLLSLVDTLTQRSELTERAVAKKIGIPPVNLKVQLHHWRRAHQEHPPSFPESSESGATL